MLRKVVSGAQTGADIGGLIVAKKYGLETGGWIPKGFITQAGKKPEYAELYGIQEHSSPLYPPRTAANVKSADATVRLAVDFESPGEKCTLKAIQKYHKPWYDVDLLDSDAFVDGFVDFLLKHNVEILNVAGNSERTFSGATIETISFLSKVFDRIGLLQVCD